jgi:hypothetical protein
MIKLQKIVAQICHKQIKPITVELWALDIFLADFLAF